MSNFEKAFLIVIYNPADGSGFEGNAYSNDPADRGGPTNTGVTEAAARRHGYAGDMKTLPIITIKAIYKADFWDALNLDMITDERTATEIFDIAVNMGTGTAGRMAQHALNLLNRNQTTRPDMPEDGVVGTQTLTALNDLTTQDRAAFYKAINALQGKRYIEICEKDPTQERFFIGWLRRV